MWQRIMEPFKNITLNLSKTAAVTVALYNNEIRTNCCSFNVKHVIVVPFIM